MASTRSRPRTGKACLHDRPLSSYLFDNWAVCPCCLRNKQRGVNNFEGISERDGFVWYDQENLTYRCRVEHVFSPESAMWEVEER